MDAGSADFVCGPSEVLACCMYLACTTVCRVHAPWSRVENPLITRDFLSLRTAASLSPLFFAARISGHVGLPSNCCSRGVALRSRGGLTH